MKYRLPFMQFIFLALLLQGCATPIPKTLNLEHQPRLGIIGFKVTAPIKHLSSIMSNPPNNLSDSQEAEVVQENLRGVEGKASAFLTDALKDENTVVPIPIPGGRFSMHPGERPTMAQMSSARKELNLDAVLFGEIPWYGRTRLIYPVLGEGLDIAAETLILGFVTGWNPGIVFGNIGFELLTSTPLWFGGYYAFGWAFRPVTIEAAVLSTSDGKEIWKESFDRLLPRKELKKYPEPERHKKEVQLEATLRKAVKAMARSLSQ